MRILVHEFPNDLRVSVITLALMCLICVSVVGRGNWDTWTRSAYQRREEQSYWGRNPHDEGRSSAFGGSYNTHVSPPTAMEMLEPTHTVMELGLTASMRFFFVTSPVNSTATLPGIPHVL